MPTANPITAPSAIGSPTLMLIVDLPALSACIASDFHSNAGMGEGTPIGRLKNYRNQSCRAHLPRDFRSREPPSHARTQTQ
jgi:hypothetical protein